MAIWLIKVISLKYKKTFPLANGCNHLQPKLNDYQPNADTDFPHLCTIERRIKIEYEPFKQVNAMSALRNKVQLIGHTGNDPEVINLESGKKLAKLTLATNETYQNEKGEKITDTQWHYVVAWGKTAELIEKYVTKGKELAVEGKLTHRAYEDKNGEKRYTTEVVASELLLLGK
jgi:single-strand DNA-binding protein